MSTENAVEHSSTEEHKDNTDPNAEGEPQEVVEEPKPINPFSYVPVMENLLPILGEKFVDSKNEPIKNIQDDVFSAKLIGLLFTSSWGSPCKIFEKELIDIYNEVNEGEKIFEIIEVSFDKKEEDFKKGITSKPWKFVPFNDPIIKKLTEKYNVLTIPKFYPIDKTGEILSNNARKELIEGGGNVCEDWIEYLEQETRKTMEEQGIKIEENKEGEKNKEISEENKEQLPQ